MFLKIFKIFVSLIIGFIIAVTIGETLLRLIPNRFTVYHKPIPIELNKECGYTYTQNHKFSQDTSYFRIYPVNTNSLGFRDSEFENIKSLTIGVLGDSFLGAMEVSENEHISAIMEKLIGNIEVLNTGVSGYGTINELLVYKKILKPFAPDIVILFFNPTNDIEENSCALNKLIHGAEREYCGYIQGGQIRIKNNYSNIQKTDLSVLKRIRMNCYTCTVIGVVVQKVFRQGFLSGTLPINYLVYMPPVKKEWVNAWKITENIIINIKEEVEENSGKLLVVSLPVYINTSKDGIEILKKRSRLDEIPEEFDVFYPSKKIQDITQKNNILLLKLEPYFIEYRDKFNLSEPYFFYIGDGHFNPLGHFLTANMVAKYLIETNLLPLSTEIEKKHLLEKIKDNLELPPIKILGEEGYRQIYGRGKYLGHSNIIKILETN